MKLVALAGGGEIALPNDLLWEDELSWVPPAAKETYSLTGALIVEMAARQAGRPITLRSADESMGWVTRETVAQLRAWASVLDKKYRLVLEYPTDTRTFVVMFKHSATPVEARPVKGFPGHEDEDYFTVTIRLMEVV